MKSNLEEWMLDKRMDQYLGRRPCFKLSVLAAVISGNEPLSAVARRYGASKQAAGKHAAAARRIFGKGNQ
jgi:transposase-like protein